MKGAEFIGRYWCPSYSKIARGVIIYKDEKDLDLWMNLLFVYYIGGSPICKRFGRKDILGKVLLKDQIIVERSHRGLFMSLKILGKGASVEKLENRIEASDEYQLWKKQ